MSSTGWNRKDLSEFYKYIFRHRREPIYYSTCCGRVFEYETSDICPKCKQSSTPNLQQTIDSYNDHYEDQWREK